MQFDIRRAEAKDIAFTAWVMNQAAQSHKPIGLWDLLFPDNETLKMKFIETYSEVPTLTLCHYSVFDLAVVDGVPVAGMSSFYPEKLTGDVFRKATGEVILKLGMDEADIIRMREGFALNTLVFSPYPADQWVIEWVACKPEYRRKGLVNALLQYSLAKGVAKGAKKAQIRVAIGNTKAQNAYEKAGFKVVDEKTHPDYEKAMGSPGLYFLEKNLQI